MPGMAPSNRRQYTLSLRNDWLEVDAFLQDQSQIVQSLTSLLGVQDKSTSDKKAYALIKSVLLPLYTQFRSDIGVMR